MINLDLTPLLIISLFIIAFGLLIVLVALILILGSKKSNRPTAPKKEAVTCKNCGATNEGILGEVITCRFCNSKITGKQQPNSPDLDFSKTMNDMMDSITKGFNNLNDQ